MACLLCGEGCDLLVNETWAGTMHSACAHGACEGCVAQWIESCLPLCLHEAQLRVPCYAPGCCKLLPQTLVFHVSEPAHSLAVEIDAQQGEMAALPPTQRDGTCEYEWKYWRELSKLKNFAARAGLRVISASAEFHGPEGEGNTRTQLSHFEGAPSIHCDCCGETVVALIAIPEDGHPACVHCWARRAEAQLDGVGIGSAGAECVHPLSWPTLRYLCSRYSEKVLCYVAAHDETFEYEERRALRKNAPAGVQCQFFQPCTICQEPCALIATNRGCGHAACMSCWRQWVESCAPTYLAECRLKVRCFAPGCDKAISSKSGLWLHLCTQSEVAQGFHDRIHSVRGHFRAFPATTWSALPWKPGPTCPICQECCWALLQNSSCGHAVCENCWALWAASQVEQLLATRRAIGFCFSPGCHDTLTGSLWQRCCAHSQAVQEFSRLPMVAARFRLQENPFYPRPLQVDCPRPECWGLGYLGFDRVMCFICECQWHPEEPGNAPEDADVELVMGVKVKKCPRCNEYIEKNGGCDHMTCRCRHEFYWSTLKPYR